MSSAISSPPPRRRRWLAYGALAIAVAGIVWSAFFVRWARVPGATSALYRVLVASCVLVPWSAASWYWRSDTDGRSRRVKRRAVIYALLGGALFACDLALYNTAVLRTTAANATLFGNNAPIFVGLGTWLLFRRRPRRAFWIGLGLSMSGAVVVMMNNMQSNSAAAGNTFGNLLALGAAMFFAGYMLTTERAREEMDTLTFSSISAVGSVVTLLVTCLLLDAPLGAFTGRTWAALVGLGLVSQLGSYLALAYALGQLPATVSSVGLLAQVPLTALLAVPLLGEPITGPQIFGGLLVLAGIVVVNRP
jgi:drug/metabolite transporter (DMT)-like permease